MFTRITQRLLFMLLLLSAGAAFSQEPKWSGSVVAFGNERNNAQQAETYGKVVEVAIARIMNGRCSPSLS